MPAYLRHHSVVDGRPLLPSSLACAQTAPGAGHAEILSRLLRWIVCLLLLLSADAWAGGPVATVRVAFDRLVEEHKLLPAVVGAVASGRLRWNGTAMFDGQRLVTPLTLAQLL